MIIFVLLVLAIGVGVGLMTGVTWASLYVQEYEPDDSEPRGRWVDDCREQDAEQDTLH